MRWCVGVILFSMLVFAGLGHAYGADQRLAAEFEGGKLYRAGPVFVVELHGSYHQMGRQYGRLLRDELRALYEIAIDEQFISEMGFTYERLRTIAFAIYDLYPQRYKEIIVGMSESSGLGLEKHVLLNAIEMYPKFNSFIPNCSGIAVWGDYTNGGPLIFGRNNDDTEFYKKFAPYVTVAVLKPADSSIPAAIVNYAGVIYAPSGMNGAGIFLELNSGTWTGYYPYRLSIFVTLLSFLQDFSTMDAIDAAFQSTRVNLSSIVNVADRDISYSFECPTFDARRRSPDRDGLMVATNHFVDPSWGMPPPLNDEQLGWTVKRRNHLLQLAKEHKGEFDVEMMKRVLDTPLDDGGATVPGTIYQIIAVPQSLQMWLKAPDNFDWQKVDLKELFAE